MNSLPTKQQLQDIVNAVRKADIPDTSLLLHIIAKYELGLYPVKWDWSLDHSIPSRIREIQNFGGDVRPVMADALAYIERIETIQRLPVQKCPDCCTPLSESDPEDNPGATDPDAPDYSSECKNPECDTGIIAITSYTKVRSPA